MRQGRRLGGLQHLPPSWSPGPLPQAEVRSQGSGGARGSGRAAASRARPCVWARMTGAGGRVHRDAQG